jgi:four helix bundle protein
MQTVHDLPVFQRGYDLYKEIYSAVKHFPKGDRYALGESCKSTTVEILTAIIQAASQRNEWKAASTDKALTETDLLKVYIRLASETECLKQSRMIPIQQKLQEIGRMLGGWKRSI